MSPTRKSHGDLTFLFCGNCVNVRVFTICVSDPNRQQDLLCKETLEMVRLIPILSQFSMWLKASQGVSRREFPMVEAIHVVSCAPSCWRQNGESPQHQLLRKVCHVQTGAEQTVDQDHSTFNRSQMSTIQRKMLSLFWINMNRILN